MRAKKIDPIKYGRSLKTMRIALGWTQAKLAEEAQICTRTVGRLESGECVPTRLVVQALHQALTGGAP
jgi:transcriptional regulator with XRE-family HTH domain